MFSFHFPTLDLQARSLVITDADMVHQMNRVLRFQPGVQAYFLNGKGVRVTAELVSIHKKEVVFQVVNHETQPAPNRHITLAFGIPKKPATLEWMLEKATELGANVLQPLLTDHGQTHHLPKPERLATIIKEASEQSERWFFPELQEPMSLQSALQLSGVKLAGDARRGKAFESVHSTEPIVILIGPEGGFSEPELNDIEHSGARLIRLGDTVLRVETAALTFLSLVRFSA